MINRLSKSGFTIMEVLVALTLIAVSLPAMQSMIFYSLSVLKKNVVSQSATAKRELGYERISGMSCDSVTGQRLSESGKTVWQRGSNGNMYGEIYIPVDEGPSGVVKEYQGAKLCNR